MQVDFPLLQGSSKQILLTPIYTAFSTSTCYYIVSRILIVFWGWKKSWVGVVIHCYLAKPDLKKKKYKS